MSNAKKKTPVGKDIAKDKILQPEIPEQETIETPQVTVDTDKERGLFGEVAENIGDGGKMVGEKTTEFADILVDKIKKGWSKAYEAGAKVVDDLSHAAQKYAEKYKAESEIDKLNDEKDRRIMQLGQSIFKHHLSGGKISESFFNKNERIEQFDQIDMLDERIVEIGRQLDKEIE